MLNGLQAPSMDINGDFWTPSIRQDPVLLFTLPFSAGQVHLKVKCVRKKQPFFQGAVEQPAAKRVSIPPFYLAQKPQ